MINLGYFGSPNFSADFLEKIILDNDLKNILKVKLVFTQPDRPAGRKQVLTPTPVKKIAIKYNIPVISLTNQKRSEEIKKIRNQKNSDKSDISDSSDLSNIRLTPISSDYSDLSGIDLALVYAFSAIIPKELLDLPKYGFWCIHPSLLPKYRGSSPMATALINGDKETGVTIFKIDEKIDHGPIIAQEKYQILPNDKRPDLEIKLTDLAFKMFLNLIKDEKKLKYLDKINSVSKNLLDKLLDKQEDKLATYTRLLKKSDGFLPLTTVKKALKNQPLTFEELPEIIKNNYLKNSKFKILNPKQIENSNDKNSKHFENLNLKNFNLFRISDLEFRASPKVIWNLFRGLYPWPGIWTILPNGKRLKITEMKLTSNNNLLITKVQLEGKKEVDFETFNKNFQF